MRVDFDAVWASVIAPGRKRNRELMSDNSHVRAKTERSQQGREQNRPVKGIDNFNAPKALGLMWQMLKDKKLKDGEKYATLLDFDKVLGFGLKNKKRQEIDEEIKKLAQMRERYRKEKQWQKADEARKEIEEKGYLIEDTEQGPKIRKK